MRDGVVYGTQGYVNIAFNAVVLCPQYVDPEFQAYYQPIKAVTAMGIECLWTIHRMAKQCRLLPGDFAELRWSLTEAEIARYREGAKRMSAAMEETCRQIKAGDSRDGAKSTA